MGGAGFSIKDEYPEKKFSTNYGVNMYLGQTSEQLDSKGTEAKTALYGFNPFIKFDANWFGIGGGVHVGNMVYTSNEIIDYDEETSAVEKTSVYPQGYLRVGPKKIIYIDYHLGDQFPAPFPCFSQQIGVGTGFGTENANLRIGGFFAPSIGAYFSAYIPVSKMVSIEPMVVFENSNIEHFVIGLHYNISSKSFYKKVRQNQ